MDVHCAPVLAAFEQLGLATGLVRVRSLCFIFLSAATLLAAVPQLASAQGTGTPPVNGGVNDQNGGFALNRFDISEVGSDWFAGDSLDLRGKVRPGFRLGIDWAHKPLVRYDGD